jgi:hypothetical protein
LDYFEEPFWNLTQTFGWIIERNPEIVRETSSNVVSQIPRVAHLLGTYDTGNDQEHMTISQAESDLILALSENTLRAKGLVEGQFGDREVIPNDWWTGAKFSLSPEGASKDKGSTPNRCDFIFYREDILRIWPSLSRVNQEANAVPKRTRIRDYNSVDTLLEQRAKFIGLDKILTQPNASLSEDITRMMKSSDEIDDSEIPASRSMRGRIKEWKESKQI